MKYITKIKIGLDQFLNALLGGYPDETLSSRWGRTRDSSPIAELASRILDRIDRDHVWDSREVDEAGKIEPHHLDSEYQVRIDKEDFCLKLALHSDKELAKDIMDLAERAARRQRLREADHDKRHPL